MTPAPQHPPPHDPPPHDSRPHDPAAAGPTARGERHRRRLDRQFAALGRLSPRLRALLDRLRGRSAAVFRVPAGLALVAGGLLSVLPGLGLWMLPVGLLVLAVDLPAQRPAVSAALIRLRRRWTLWRRR